MSNKKIWLVMAILGTILNVLAFAGGNSERNGNNEGENLPKIVIINNTGYEVAHYKLRHSGNLEWQFRTNVVLRNGDSVIVNLPYPLSVQSKDHNQFQPPTDYYDIQLIDTDGDAYSKFLVLIYTDEQAIEFTFNDIGSDENYRRPDALPGYN